MKRKWMVSLYFVIVFSLMTVSVSMAEGVKRNHAGTLSDANQEQNNIFLPLIYSSPAWVEVGENSASGWGISHSTRASNPAIGIAPDNTVYVAWVDGSAEDFEIYIRHWNGSNWVEVGEGSASGGGISNDSDASGGSSIAIDPDGMPYVGWVNFKDENGIGLCDVYIRHWNGNGWEEVGPGSASGGGISNTGKACGVSLAISPDGSLYVVWPNFGPGDSEIYILRWNGNSWEEVGENSAHGGGISNTPNGSNRPALAIAPDGTPYVTWEEEDQITADIYVRRWNGTTWEEVGEHSASGGGISNNWSFYYSFSLSPSIAITPSGIPFIAWQDNDSGNHEIYVRRWNENIWEEVGDNSAQGGGISNTPGYSGTPSIAISPDGIPYITWTDNGEIIVRRYNEDYWDDVGEDSPGYGGGIIAIDYNNIPYIIWTDVYFPYASDTAIYILRWLE